MPVKSADTTKLSHIVTKFGDAITLMVWFDTAENRFKGLPNLQDGVSSPKYDLDIQGGIGYIAVAKSSATHSFEGVGWSTDEINISPTIFPLPLLAKRTPIIVLDGNLNGVPDGVSVRVENVTKGISGLVEVEHGKFTTVLMGLRTEHEVGDLIRLTINIPEGKSLESFQHQLTHEEIIAGLVKMKPQVGHFSAKSSTPIQLALMQNYPNPFNPDTWIPYQLSEETEVTIEIYNVIGRLIRCLHLGNQMAGSYLSKEKAAYWDGKNEDGEPVASGVYFYRLKNNKGTMRRAVIIK